MRGNLGLGARLLYASAHFGISALAFSVMQYLGYFWQGSPERGIPARVDGLALAAALLIGRVLDGIIDPLVGYWSDRTRTRWGRRKPFLVAGIVPVTAGFLLLWWSPDAGPSAANAAYLLAALTLFYFAFTLVSCPYLALLPEIAPSERERVGLAGLQAVFNVLGNVAGAVVGGILIANPSCGFLGMGIAIGLVSAISFVLAALGPREPAGRSEDDRGVEKLALGRALAETFRNPAFSRYGLAFMVFWMGLSVVIASETYIATVLLGRKEADAGLLTGAALIAAACLVPLTMRATLRWGKRVVFLVSLCWFGLAAPALGYVDLLPGDGFLWAIGLMLFAGPPISGLLVLPYALLAEITDEDEARTGRRREATYFGVNGFLYKAGLALGGAIAAVAWRLLGHTAEQPLGLRVSGLVATVFALLGAAIFLGYPLGRAESAGEE